MNILRRIRKSNGAAINSILLTFVQVVTTVLGIIVTKLLSVNFSLREYGTYSQALLITTTVTSFSILGLTNATNYFYNRTKNEVEQRKYVATIFTIQYIVGISAAVLLVVFRTAIAGYFRNNRLVGILPIVALTPMLTNLIAMYQTLFVSIGMAKLIAARNLAVSIIRLLAVVVACFILNNIVTVLVVIFVLNLVQVVYFIALYKYYKEPILLKNTRLVLVKEILAFSIPMSIYVITNSLSRDIDKYVISAFSDTETLAIYTNAAKILPFDMLTTSLITVLIPIITQMINRKKFDDARDVFKLYLRIGYILTFIFVGGAIAVSEDLMAFLYDKKYLMGLPVFIIYLFVDMIRFANVTTILSAAGKTKVLMTVSITGMVLNAVMNVFAFKIFGLIGPAAVTLLITVGMTLALLYFGAKEIKCKVTSLFDVRELMLILVEITIIGFIEFFLMRKINNVITSGFLRIAICYGSYVIAMISINYRRIVNCFRELNVYKI